MYMCPNILCCNKMLMDEMLMLLIKINVDVVYKMLLLYTDGFVQIC